MAITMTATRTPEACAARRLRPTAYSCIPKTDLRSTRMMPMPRITHSTTPPVSTPANRACMKVTIAGLALPLFTPPVIR